MYIERATPTYCGTVNKMGDAMNDKREQIHSGSRASQGKSAKVTYYTNRNGPIRWQISTSVKVIREHFSLALIIF